MEALVNADWRGNIRELENFLERCVILTQGDELNVPRAELNRSAGRTVIAAASTFEQAERQAILDALKGASGRIAGNLLARRIPAQADGIVHGDYRAGNVAFGPDGAIRAVFDWSCDLG